MLKCDIGYISSCPWDGTIQDEMWWKLKIFYDLLLWSVNEGNRMAWVYACKSANTAGALWFHSEMDLKKKLMANRTTSDHFGFIYRQNLAVIQSFCQIDKCTEMNNDIGYRKYCWFFSDSLFKSVVKWRISELPDRRVRK